MKTIGRADVWQGVYLLPVELPTCALTSSTAIYNFVSTYNIWHARLGHASPKYLLALKNILHIESLPKHEHDDPCLVCPLAKQKRLCFDSHNHISDQPFELVHCDVMFGVHMLHLLMSVIDIFSLLWIIALDIRGLF